MSQLVFRINQILLSQGQTDYFLSCGTLMRDSCEILIEIGCARQTVNVDFLPIFLGELFLAFKKLEVQEQVVLRLLYGNYGSMKILPVDDKIRIELHPEEEKIYIFPLVKYSEFYDAVMELINQFKQRYDKLSGVLASDNYYKNLTDACRQFELHLNREL